MKIYGTVLLVLSVFYPWGTTNAFVAQVTNALAPWLEKATPKSKIKNKPPPTVATMDENRRKSLEARLAALQVGGGGRLARANAAKKMLETSLPPITLQGGSLQTWSFASSSSSSVVERVQVVLQTEGRPFNADIELWQGPDNTPHKMRVYVEDGSMRPFSAVIENPSMRGRGGPITIAIRNIGQMEFPLAAYVVAAAADKNNNSNNGSLSDGSKSFLDTNTPTTTTTVQGGALRTFSFEPSVESVQVLLKTDGHCPLNARIELLQGPTNKKQVIELYTEDGMDRPFFAVIETPGVGNVVRVVNTATMEYPLTASVEPYLIDSNQKSSGEAVLRRDNGGGLLWNHRPW